MPHNNSLDFYKKIFFNSKFGMAVYDSTGQCIETNNTMAKMVGTTTEQLLGQNFREIESWKKSGMLDSALKALDENKEVCNEVALISTFGKDIEAKFHFVPFVSDKKKYLLLIYDDLSELIKSYSALNESEKKFRQLFENMAQGVFYQNKDGSLIDINPAALKMFGLTQEQFNGRDSYNPEWKVICEDGTVIPPEDHPSMVALRTGKPVIDNLLGVYNPSKKEYIWLIINALPQFEEDDTQKPSHVLVTMHDLTKRKETEESIQQEHSLLQSVMKGAKNSHLVYLDRDFNFVRVNEAYATTCGFSPEEMIGKNHFALYPHDENEAIFTRVRDTGEPFEIHDKPFEFLDQPERGVTYWDWTLIPEKDKTGQVKGLIFSLFETTKRKQAELALQEVKDELAKRVQERTAELEQKTIGLEESNIALKVLMKQREKDKKELEKNILFNVNKLVGPSLEKLKKITSDNNQKVYLEVIESNLNEIISPFAPGLSANLSKLTPAEIQIADFIRQGRTTKEIASLLGLSPSTIAAHRQNIRKKLALTNKEKNLRTILTTNSQ